MSGDAVLHDIPCYDLRMLWTRGKCGMYAGVAVHGTATGSPLRRPTDTRDTAGLFIFLSFFSSFFLFPFFTYSLLSSSCPLSVKRGYRCAFKGKWFFECYFRWVGTADDDEVKWAWLMLLWIGESCH